MERVFISRGFSLHCQPPLSAKHYFTKFFQGAARRAGITDTSVFLLGFDTIALQAEKNLWSLSEWVKQNNTLNLYLQSNPTAKIAENFMSSVPPDEVSPEVWIEWKKSNQSVFLKSLAVPLMNLILHIPHRRKHLHQPLNP